MKALLLFFVLLNLYICQDEYKNIERSGRIGSCTPETFFSSLSYDADLTLSDCVDRNLEIPEDYGKGGLFDKCCYMRVMINGIFRTACIGLERKDTIDIPGYIPSAEDDLKRSMLEYPEMTELLGFEMTEGTEVKIYSIDCDASYIKFFVSIFALFCLLF